MKPYRAIDAHNSYVLGLRFETNGTTLFSAGMDNVIHRWDSDDGTRMATFTGHAKSVNCLAITPDTQTLVTGSSDATVRIWDVATQRPRHTLQDRKRVVSTLAISPDAQQFAAGSYKGRVALWTLAGETVNAFPASDGNLTVVAYRPTRSDVMVTAGLGPTMQVWHLPEAKASATLETAAAAITQARFTPDGRHLVALGYGGQIHVWDATTWEERPDLTFDAAGARTFSLNVQGDRCAMLHKGRAELRAYPTWNLLETLETEANVLTTAAFSPSGNRVAVGGADGKIRIYRLSP